MSKRKAKDVVEIVLRDYPKSRNSDRDLIAVVWHMYGLKLTLEQYDKLMEVPSAETIRRIRQKLQENGKYLADKQVQLQREQLSQEMEQNTPSASTSTIERILSNERTQ